jgi:hypothetical protein
MCCIAWRTWKTTNGKKLMIDHDEFHSAMLRMSRFTLGVKEAIALFSIGDGATLQTITQRCSDEARTMQTRLGMLRSKGYLLQSEKVDGKLIYRLSPLGLEIINKTLGK